MRYDPTAAQDSEKQSKPGTYFFSVTSAEETVSQAAGNEMIKLSLAVAAGGSDPINVYDYLVNTPGGLWKAKMFADEVGLDFDSGELTAAACLGKSGKAVFNYAKKDLAEVAAGKAERAYLKVIRYGVHEEAGADPAATKGHEPTPKTAPPTAEPLTPDGTEDDTIPF